MAHCKFYDFAAGGVSERDVDTSKFGVRAPRKVQRDAVLMYQANQRAGTHSTLDRSEVRTSKKKPWKQKHTGRARAGRKSSPLWRGGGVAHGPHPRDYSYGVPRKALRAATRAAVAGKVADGEVAFCGAMGIEEPCTKKAAGMLSALGVRGSFLLVVKDHDENAWKSVRNIEGASMLTADDVNAYEVLRNRTVIFADGALERLAERVGMAVPEESAR